MFYIYIKFMYWVWYKKWVIFYFFKLVDLKRNEEDGILRSKYLIMVEIIKLFLVKYKIWLMFWVIWDSIILIKKK